MLTKAVLESVIEQEPHAVVRGLIKAQKTGSFSIKSTIYGNITADVVTLRVVDGKVVTIPHR